MDALEIRNRVHKKLDKIAKKQGMEEAELIRDIDLAVNNACDEPNPVVLERLVKNSVPTFEEYTDYCIEYCAEKYLKGRK